jgi:hypothetical protein
VVSLPGIASSNLRLLIPNRMINNPVHGRRIIGRQAAGKVYTWNRQKSWGGNFMRRFGYLFLILPALAGADSIRCGGYLVNTGDSQSRALQLCGEPQSARPDGFIEQVVRRSDGGIVLNPNLVNPVPPNPSYPGYLDQSRYETEYRRVIPVYKWEYNLGHGTFLKILTFHGDTLVDIADGPRQ